MCDGILTPNLVAALRGRPTRRRTKKTPVAIEATCVRCGRDFHYVKLCRRGPVRQFCDTCKRAKYLAYQRDYYNGSVKE